MASAFGHALASTGISTWNRTLYSKKKFWWIMAALAILPDIDAVGSNFGIPYDSPMGHRGFTHSVLFALIVSGVAAKISFPKRFQSSWFFFFLAILSHGLLDACTNGGRGVGFWIPFWNERYFFPYRPIEVSPLGIGRFFTARGGVILISEAFWIGIPVAFSFAAQKAIAACKRLV